ncbi:MAG TPA: HRDC domain-containing protein [Gemmatimonadaceae bacterium]|nr:HRDC domain-containing protein [Gemmatimonadaceae bacterium]
MTVPSDPQTPIYLDEPDATDRFLSSLGQVRSVALDTEGASYHRFVDRIYLIQLTTREASAIIDPLAVGTPAKLGALIESPEVEVVFHDADYDLRLLHQDYGWQARNIFDTRVAAQLLGIRAFGLAALLERYFHVRLDKKHQRADWSMRPLTGDMLDYAAQDTLYLLELRDRLRDELAARDRLAWAAEEFARLEGTRWEDGDSSAAYMRIKGARDLTRRELALFRELVAWRDGVAAELDRATFRVVGNEALLEAARTAPTTPEELLRVKGMPRTMVDRRGAEILAAIRRGLDVPEKELPKFPRPPRWDRDPDFDTRVAALKQVRDHAAQQLDLDPGVLGARDRLEAVARRNPSSLEELSEVKELRRWQVEVLGERFLEALRKVDSPYK